MIKQKLVRWELNGIQCGRRTADQYSNRYFGNFSTGINTHLTDRTEKNK